MSEVPLYPTPKLSTQEEREHAKEVDEEASSSSLLSLQALEGP